MSEVFKTIFTNVGLNLLAQAQVTGNKVNITHIAVGDSNGSYYEPVPTATALKNEKWRGPIANYYPNPKSTAALTIDSVLPADEGTAFTAREIALYDNNGNMITIGKIPATEKPDPSSGAAKDLYFKINIQMANAANITITLDPTTAYATVGYVDSLVQGITKENLELDNVENYAIATQIEAEAGTASNKYMTPQRTKQAVDKTVGPLASLTTTNKTTIVQAVSEVKDDLTSHLEQSIAHNHFAVATGTNALSLTINGITGLVSGLSIRFKNTTANTGAATLNINGLGAKAIVKGDGGALTANKLKVGGLYTVVYDGTAFFLQGEVAEYGTATASHVLQGQTVGTENGLVNGTIPIKSAQTYTPSTVNQTIPSGQYLGDVQTILGDADLIPANILSGKTIFDVAGSLVPGKRSISGVVFNPAKLTKSLYDINRNTTTIDCMEINQSLGFTPNIVIAFNKASPNTSYRPTLFYREGFLGSTLGSNFITSNGFFGMGLEVTITSTKLVIPIPFITSNNSETVWIASE